VICNHSQSSCTQRVRVAEVFELCTAFDISWFDSLVITVSEVEKTFSFHIRCLKDHLPSVSKLIAFFLFAEIPRWFAREEWDRIEQFGLNANHFMKKPIAMTGTFPEFDQVLLMVREKSLKFLKDRSCVTLVRMRRWIKKIFTVWIKSVMTMIFEMPEELVVWLIPHLMANNRLVVNVNMQY